MVRRVKRDTQEVCGSAESCGTRCGQGEETRGTWFKYYNLLKDLYSAYHCVKEWN